VNFRSAMFEPNATFQDLTCDFELHAEAEA